MAEQCCIDEPSTESQPQIETQQDRRNFETGQLAQALSYLGVCGYLVWLVVKQKQDAELVSKIDNIVFIDFFGYFLISLLFSGGPKSIRWSWPLEDGLVSRLLGYAVLILGAGWFMEGVAGWPLTIIWMVSVLMSVTDIPALRTGAIVRVIWAMVSGFLVALVASMAGVKEENLLSDHSPTLFAWGLLYFGGVAVFRMVCYWLSRSLPAQ